jgi:cytochrome c oxidase cbb3-type subunit 3
MFSQTSDFLTSKYFLGTALISVIIVFIQTAHRRLIENEKFKKMTDAEKAVYLNDKKVPYFKYFGTGHSKVSLKEEKGYPY